MALFWTDSIVMLCSSVDAAKQWWIETFNCKQEKLPNWDNPLPSDVALKLPDHEEPTILLCDQSEFKNAGLTAPATVPILFTDDLKKAQNHLAERNVLTGPIQEDGETEFFEIRDPDGNLIEICREPTTLTDRVVQWLRTILDLMTA